jgi:hypothetical protein
VVDRDDASAGFASTQIGLVLLIQSEVPQHHAFGPVPRCADDQLHRFLKQLAFLPLAAGAFREPNALFWEAVVELALGSYRASVTMNRSTRGIGCGLRVVQDGHWKFNLIPVVIKDQDFGFDPGVAKSRTEIFSNEL